MGARNKSGQGGRGRDATTLRDPPASDGDKSHGVVREGLTPPRYDVGVDRREFLIGAGGAAAWGAAAAPMRARAQPASVIVPYFDRLRRGLADAGGGGFVDATENHLLALHNGFRAEHGLPALTRSSALDEAARAHVADLLKRDYFAHKSPEGFSSEHRVGLIARRFVGAAGENIAMQEGGASAPNAADFSTMWRESPGHRANMLRRNYTQVGFGVVSKGDKTIAGAVFGELYTELPEAAPFRIGRGGVLAGLLDGAAPALSGYELYPVDGGEAVGPFAAEAAPQALSPGAYAIRPHAPDPSTPHRYWILFGPIVMAG